MKRIQALAASLLVVVGLAACTGSPPDTVPSAPSGTPTSTTPTLAIPECTTLLPVDLAKEYFHFRDTHFVGELSASEFTGRESIASVPAILSTADPYRICEFAGSNSYGSFPFYVLVATITTEQRATLERELRAADYSQSTTGTVTSFAFESMGAETPLGFTHLFTGDTWVACDGTSGMLADAVTAQVLDVLRAANPDLGL